MKRTSLGLSEGWARWWLVVGCLPLALVMGCPQDQTGAPGKASKQTTAPAMPAPTPMPKGALAQTGAAPNAAIAAAPASAQTPAQAQKVQQLINQAERAYTSGVSNYRSGKLDAARNDFDFAVDLMLTSGLDLKSDPQLSDEFDRLLSSVNSLEMAALKQGNGFSAPVEAAPLDAATDLTFAPNPELVAKLKTELNTASDLPLIINDQVAGYIDVFSTSDNFRRHMAASMQRVGKYRGLIEQVLKEEGVPQDLIYLAVAESGFQPQAINARSGAGGMWQFMTYTGPEYGLVRNGYFDYRFDPEKSTRAYARYIKKLYGITGDWYLAMASYDWGLGNVQRAVMRTGYADFWELYRRNAMPAETRAYVPKILAAVIMAKNPERYGLDKLIPSPPVIYDTVSTDYGIDVRLVADVTNVSVQEIVALNPSLLRLSTPRDISFDLHIPPGTKQLYVDRLKAIPEDKRASWRFHVAKTGETLESVATALHSHASDVAAASGLSVGDPVEEGDELVVPVVTVASGARPQRYTVRRGDTLVTVADRFNVSVEELRGWNHLRSKAVSAGRTLAVTEPVRMSPTAHLRGRGSRGRGGARGKANGSRGSSAATLRRTGIQPTAIQRTGSSAHGSSASGAGSSTKGTKRSSASASTKRKAAR